MRRAFTSFQLMTILEENHHTFLIVEHDPLLYEDASEMVEYVAQHLRQTFREANDLALCILHGPAPGKDDPAGRPGVLLLRDAESTIEVPRKSRPEDAKAQVTLEAYS